MNEILEQIKQAAFEDELMKLAGVMPGGVKVVKNLFGHRVATIPQRAASQSTIAAKRVLGGSGSVASSIPGAAGINRAGLLRSFNRMHPASPAFNKALLSPQ